MQEVLDVDDDTRMAGNYFTQDYLATDVKTGVTRNRGGTRMLALTDDFLLGLHTALTQECGPAADEVFRSCGRTFGAQLARKLSAELQQFYGKPLTEFPMAMFEACLKQAFGRHGWGDVAFDFTRHDKGVVVVDLKSAVFADLLPAQERPADPLMAGVLAGMFSSFAGRSLGCLQTQCSGRGDGVSRFVLTDAARIDGVAELAAAGKPHDEILAALERSTSAEGR